MKIIDILKSAGLTSTEISAIDEKVMLAFNSILDQCELERSTAQDCVRSNHDFYKKTILPALLKWEREYNSIRNRVAQEREVRQ